jgi:hypothetical protein
MPHLNVYVDEETRKKIRAAARKDKSSLSKWARKAFTRELKNGWPEGYAHLFGALADVDIRRPPQPRWEDDVPREPL